MFNKMFSVLLQKLYDGNEGYRWNSDAENFYSTMYEMALAGIITDEQMAIVDEFVRTEVYYLEERLLIND